MEVFFDMKRLGLLFCDLGYDVVASHAAGAAFGFDIGERVVRGRHPRPQPRHGVSPGTGDATGGRQGRRGVGLAKC
jgi:hypothetical protein